MAAKELPAVVGPPRPRYVVLDTESSYCQCRRRRYLVSLAYEVIDSRGGVHHTSYSLVQPPVDAYPDAQSLGIHGITPPAATEQDVPFF